MIKDLRAESRMTQAQFSNFLNIPKRTIENWEGGVNKCPGYLQELIEYKLRKEIAYMKNYKGARWGCLSEEEREYLLSEAGSIDGRTGSSPKESGECIIDLAYPFSVPGYLQITEAEDEIIIEDDAVIYASTK